MDPTLMDPRAAPASILRSPIEPPGPPLVRRMKSATYTRESLAQVRADGIEQLLELHYREIAHFQDIALDVDWEKYERAEASGHLRAFIARVDGRMVGYMAILVDHNGHYRGSLQAVQDVLFIEPRWRGGWLAYRLLHFAHLALLAEGVQVVYQHIKAQHDHSRLLLKIGYELVDLILAKRLDRDVALAKHLSRMGSAERSALEGGA